VAIGLRLCGLCEFQSMGALAGGRLGGHPGRSPGNDGSLSPQGEKLTFMSESHPDERLSEMLAEPSTAGGDFSFVSSRSSA
jgi:hypothetical protein